MSTLHLDLTITLLEDLHSGTGSGDMLVDAAQAVNAEGFPFIDRQHFRGVLKDNALRLKALGMLDDDWIERVFGAGGDAPRSLDCSSLVATARNCLRTWESTARRPGSRCPEDHSLRRVQYINAGTTLKGWIRIENAETGDKEKLETLIRFTNRLGGGRTRGDGQIKMQWSASGAAQAAQDPDTKATRLRLMLKALEPVTLPKSGHAGNLIGSESHIPGRVLFGALCASQETPEAIQALFSESLAVGNAYPFPARLKDNIHAAMPMPAHLHQRKAAYTGPAKNHPWPHWASRNQNSGKLQPGKDIDIFQYRGNDKTQRPKGEQYLLHTSGGHWYRHVQPLEVRMRNRRGAPLAFGTQRGELELFTEERIPAGTLFLWEVRCDDETLRQTLWPRLRPATRFRVGRSKAPVEIIRAEVVDQTPPTGAADAGELTLIATSDWILRGENLAPLSALDKTRLFELLGLSGSDIDNLKFEPAQETETHGGFNYATRLPRRPFAVIRRGSVFRISGDPQAVQNVLSALNKMKHIGERITEGYGGFVVNPPLPDLDREAQPGGEETCVALDALQSEAETAEAPPSDSATLPDPEQKQKQEPEPKPDSEPDCPDIVVQAAAYAASLRQRAADLQPDPGEWQQHKEALAHLRDNQTVMDSMTNQSEFFYRLQRANNLWQYLRGADFDGDMRPCLPAFLDALEQALFTEDKS